MVVGFTHTKTKQSAKDLHQQHYMTITPAEKVEYLPCIDWGVSLRVGLSAISFLLFKTKKDAAAIPNAASRLPYSKKVKQLPSVVFYPLIFNAFTKTYAEKTKRAVFCQRSERNKKRRN